MFSTNRYLSSTWTFNQQGACSAKRVSIAMVDSWFNSIMALYYRGLKAKRVSLVVDSDDLFRAMKKLMERYEIKDEMSVILVSMETGKVLEEYVAPLTDGRTAELVLTGEIKEEQHDEYLCAFLSRRIFFPVAITSITG